MFNLLNLLDEWAPEKNMQSQSIDLSQSKLSAEKVYQSAGCDYENWDMHRQLESGA